MRSINISSDDDSPLPGTRRSPRPARLLITLTTALVATSSVGCASLSRTEEGALIGVAAGAAAGAAIGNAAGSTTKGAILGAVLGGTAGALIGRRMDAKAAELERRLPGASVERVGEGILITFESGILFGFDSAELSAPARQNLTALANSLSDMEEDAVLLVAGHTDSVGRDAYNQTLSERRAQSAVQFLLREGMSPARMQSTGLGETEPVATNETEEGQAANRRVEVAIYASEAYRERVRARAGG